MNVKFHKNCENTGKILKISIVRCNFVKFDIHFLGLPWEMFFGGLARESGNPRYSKQALSLSPIIHSPIILLAII